MRITASGNVGIGTTNPSAKLDVTGDIKLSAAGGGLIFPDGSKQTTAGSGGKYIQNTTTQPAERNFKISGEGTPRGAVSGNIIYATTRYNHSARSTLRH